MKNLTLIALLLAALPVLADGNNNNTIVVKPQITVNNAACCCTKKKPKTIVKTVVKEVVVEKVVEKPVFVDVEKRVLVEVVRIKKTKPKKNRISVLGGVGPAYLTKENAGQADLKTGAVGGIQYQRLVTERVNLGVQIQTNQTVLGSVGFDF